MQNRLSLQQLNYNVDYTETIKTTQHTRLGQENFKIPLTSKPNKIMQSLQGLNKFFSNKLDQNNYLKEATQFQSVQQQITEMKQKTQQRTCSSLSPKKGFQPIDNSGSNQANQLLSSIKMDNLLRDSHQHSIPKQLFSCDKSPHEQKLSSKPPQTSSQKKKKISNIVQELKHRSSSIGNCQSPGQQQPERFSQLQSDLCGRIKQLESQLCEYQNSEQTQKIENMQKDKQNLLKQLEEKDKYIQSQTSKLIIFEKQLNDLNSQIVQLQVQNEFLESRIKQKDYQLQQFQSGDFQLVRNEEEYRRLLETEKSFEKIKQQIPYLTTAMKQMQNVFESLETIPEDKDCFDKHQMSLSSVSMVEMINDIQESNNNNINQYRHNLRNQQECRLLPLQEDQSNKNVKQESLTQIIQKHLSKRSTKLPKQ